MAEASVTLRTPQDVAALHERLENPEPVARAIGALLVRESFRAFTDQTFGEFKWPARYPEQGEPFVNYAAVLEAANRGQEPLSRFFDRRPALLATGAMRKSVGWMLEGRDAVAVGSSLPYAAQHQHGGETSFTVSQLARDTLRAWAIREGALGSGPEQKGANARARKVLGLSYLHRWSQQIGQRPFVGVTPRAGLRISQALAEFTATGAT